MTASDEQTETTAQHQAVRVEKLRTGISSFDIIAKGGLPQDRTTLDLRHRRQRQDRVRHAVPGRGHRSWASPASSSPSRSRPPTSARTC